MLIVHNTNQQMMTSRDDLYEGCSFSIPRSIKEKINDRARSLRMTRSDYLKALVLQDLDRGPDAPLEIRPTLEVPKRGVRQKP